MLPLTLPASSFISIDRIDENGDIKKGHRQIIGRFAPRNQPRPQLFVPSRVAVSRELVRAFSRLDLILVNVQNVRGKQLATSIAEFLKEASTTVPMLIVASSPADLVFTGALSPPSSSPVVLQSFGAALSLSVREVNRDRPQAERQFCSAIEGLSERSEILSRFVNHARRTWWSTRQSISTDEPREAVAFSALYSESLESCQGCELELLEETRRLILQEARNASMRADRRNAVLASVMQDSKPGTTLVLVRSEGASEEVKQILAAHLSIEVAQLSEFGISVANVFGAWPSVPSDTCVACGYFGTGTIDMIFASGASKVVVIADPVEARVAIWDVEKRFGTVDGLPTSVIASLKNLSSKLECVAAPSVTPISIPLQYTSSRANGFGGVSAGPTKRPRYVCICFTDGSIQQVAANARFEVVGRKRLTLQSLSAKELQPGDQVVLLKDGEYAGFSERLLQAMDEGRFKSDKDSRAIWLTTLRAVRSASASTVSEIKRRLEAESIAVDANTIRTWLPRKTSGECGVPDSKDAFLAFARSLNILIPSETLSDWYDGIHRLRVNHRKIGRELVRAIRGAYLGRLDPVTVARLEKEWGVEAKSLLEAARVVAIDEVIPLGGELHD
jgi:hypothetical protein